MLWRKLKDADTKLLTLDLEKYKRNRAPSELEHATTCTLEFLERAFTRIREDKKLVVIDLAMRADFNREMKAQSGGKNTPAHTADETETKAKAKAKVKAKAKKAAEEAAKVESAAAFYAGLAAAAGVPAVAQPRAKSKAERRVAREQSELAAAFTPKGGGGKGKPVAKLDPDLYDKNDGGKM